MLSSAALDAMQAESERTMLDTCVPQVQSVTGRNAAGEDVVVYTPGAAIRCGLRWLTAEERAQSELTPTPQDAELRVPLGTDFALRDRVQVTHRFGVASVTLFEVAGGPRDNAAETLYSVRRVVV